MKKGLIFVICFLGFVCTNVFGQTYKYDSVITLEGVFISAIADAAITSDEKPHKYTALKLNKPISVLCKSDDQYCETEDGVMLLQLVLKDAEWSKYKKLKGKKVKVQGTLFHSDNGNHFTSVLLDVSSITH
jgi:hypothetical protein